MNNSIINQLIGSHRPFVNVKTLWTMHGTDTLPISNVTRCGNHQEKNRISHNFYNITKMLANMSTRAFVMHVTIMRAVLVFFLLGWFEGFCYLTIQVFIDRTEQHSPTTTATGVGFTQPDSPPIQIGIT